MKKLLSLIGVAALLATTTNAQTATTNAPPDFFSGLGTQLNSLGISTSPTNYAVAIFYGRSLKGNKSAEGIMLVENVNNNIGICAGIDTLQGGGKLGSANIVGGGITIKSQTHPLRWLAGQVSTNTATWAYNARAVVYGVSLVGTPLNGTGSADGGLSAVNRVGAVVDLFTYKNFQFSLGGDYGNRTGAGNYSGNWIDVLFSVRAKF